MTLVTRLALWTWASLLLGGQGLACQVPVFRYALDHWEPDRYVLEAPPAAAQQEELAGFFRNLGSSSPLNLDARLNAGATEAQLFFPGTKTVGWRGTLTPATIGVLTNSPARAELTRRLLCGDSAVWVLVENTPKADEVAARVESRMRLLKNVAQLPRIDPNDPDSKLKPGPELKLDFSLLRVPADDPAEAAFIRMLAGPSAKGDSGFTALPALAVVFGRGRVLRAGPAEGFDEAAIEEASLFLLRACSCRVKRENPGWDLLTSVKWDEALAAAASAQPAPPTPAATAPERLPETVKIEPAPLPAPVVMPITDNQKRGIRTTLAWAGAIVFVALAAFLFRKL